MLEYRYSENTVCQNDKIVSQNSDIFLQGALRDYCRSLIYSKLQIRLFLGGPWPQTFSESLEKCWSQRADMIQILLT